MEEPVFKSLIVWQKAMVFVENIGYGRIWSVGTDENESGVN